jgi:prophage regulatory protein
MHRPPTTRVASDCTPRSDGKENALARTQPLALDQKQSAGSSLSMPEPDRIIRLKTVIARTELSRSTIYRKINEGTFPAQIKISVNGSGWHESDINRWVADPAAWRPKRKFDEVV